MKIIKKCKVFGVLSVHNYLAACGSNNVGDNSKCNAHGNTKCEHMVKTKEESNNGK